jgi:phosphoglycerate dehydrogenase-like enzyme
MTNVVLNLARPTPGDKMFYRRWEKIGHVYKEIPENKELVTILVVDQRYDVTPAVLAGFPNLRYVCSATTGHSHLKFDPQTVGVNLVTLRGEYVFLRNIRSVAEFTIFSLLRMCRPDGGIGNVLAGKTLGVIGVGRIGSMVVDLADAFKMKTLTFDKGSRHSYLKEIFARSDFTSVHLEENPSTLGLIDREVIFTAKLGAYLVNTARGSICDESAIVDALRNGRLAGAAIDVTHNEAAYNNVSGLNLIRTNHIAGSTIEDRIRTDEFILSQLVLRIRRDDGVKDLNRGRGNA